MKRVCALALDGVSTFDLSSVVQMFGRGPDPSGEPAGFTLTVCGRTRAVRSMDGFDLSVRHGLEAMDDADIVMVPGRHPYAEAPPSDVVETLRSAHDRGSTLASICIGAFVLAHTGLLDNRRATTHWAYSDELARRFPAVDVRPEPLYVDDGDVLTSAGLAAGLDLCLHIVRREAGSAAAARLARWNIVSPHREGGQAQFIPPRHRFDRETDLGPVLAWARERLHEPLPLTRLAAHAHVSTRTLNRRFVTELGITPKQWIIDQRVALAREMLEDATIGVDAVARQAGFPSAAALRHHLRNSTTMTPSAYRRTFAESMRSAG
jgi:transcriptional regulator GlxA family with amidase domain